MSTEDNLNPNQFTKSGKRRHKMGKFTTYGGTNLFCEHCDSSVKHPTKKTAQGEPVQQWDHRDKTGMKEAWEAHKAENP
jgi:hypothetical protein